MPPCVGLVQQRYNSIMSSTAVSYSAVSSVNLAENVATLDSDKRVADTETKENDLVTGVVKP